MTIQILWVTHCNLKSIEVILLMSLGKWGSKSGCLIITTIQIIFYLIQMLDIKALH